MNHCQRNKEVKYEESLLRTAATVPGMKSQFPVYSIK